MKYNLSNAIGIFKLCGIFAFDIERTNLSIAERKETIRAGKVTKDGEQIELDGLAFKGNVIWLIEYTNSGNLDTKDFDNFVRKISLLSDNSYEKLKEAIDKIWLKFKPDIEKPLISKDTVLLGLYIAPFKSESQEMTLRQRIASNEKSIFLWCRDTLEYFNATSSVTREHAQYELYSHFLLEPEDIFSSREVDNQESYIHRPYIEIEDGVFGCKMLIFKFNPNKLLQRAYVLRNEGWKSDSFQRMIVPEKLKNIRNYIINGRDTSFANNIIISLDPGVNPDLLKTGVEGRVGLPNRFGTLCIIDGQHRLLAFTQDFYGEEDSKELGNDRIIKEMAEKEELIVTLLIFDGSPSQILKKQTQLFRDINATQTKVKSDFIYNLEEIIDPKAPESIGNKIIKYLNRREHGVFLEKFSVKWYQGKRIKRSSLIKWGLLELVDTKKEFFYKRAPRPVKEKFENGDVDEYVLFCSEMLEKYFLAIRDVFQSKFPTKNIWAFPSENDMMLLSTSTLVGFLRLFRHFLYSEIPPAQYSKYLTCIKVRFEKEKYKFTSSQWPKLEEAIFDDIRKKYKKFGNEALIKRSK